jgi:hypothetical protein
MSKERTGASDDELGGAICAWDRVEAYASSRKHAAIAELMRRLGKCIVICAASVLSRLVDREAWALA